MVPLTYIMPVLSFGGKLMVKIIKLFPEVSLNGHVYNFTPATSLV